MNQSLTVFYKGMKREIENAEKICNVGQLKAFLESLYGVTFSDHILFILKRNRWRLLGPRCDETPFFEKKSVLLIYRKINSPSTPVLVNLRFTAGAVAMKWFNAGDELTKVMRWAELEFHVPPKRQKLEIYNYEMEITNNESNLLDYVTCREDPVITLIEQPDTLPEVRKTIYLNIIDPTTDAVKKMTFQLQMSDTLHTMIRELRCRDPSVYFGSRYQILMRGRKPLPIAGVEIERLALEDGAHLILFLYI